MTATEDYPFSECLGKVADMEVKRMPSKLEEGAGDPYTKLMTMIGAILAQEDGDARKQLALHVWSCVPRAPRTAEHWQMLPPTPPESVEGDKEQRFTSRPTPSASDNVHKRLPFYSARLHEWLQKARLPFEPDFQEHDFQDWEATFHIRGKDYKSLANEKKTAQHQAAKKACEDLGIRT